ncbi:helix-turn-helix transcriptional regulator [Amycolatopsis sp., V23-08]|uniref:Helix-turn-helix transcriptional regulator n=1 Tax=Amycolatopsis heterodermiae TaxID=3110235 RepID=A0ABU5RDY7_9PSEU|nr:helix-turn-helix transcriptional regulator [Amycolatopsis sp., V23-08]MEA5364482.1 helix-turn-helix transcriptional regulator [Amycolatopsis sp., V23-08]
MSKRQQLAAELRSSRELAGKSGRALAKEVGISQAKVSRIESAQTVPSRDEVAAWLAATDVPERQRVRVLELTDSVFKEVNSWRAVLRARQHHQDDVEELETSARLVHCYQPAAVPGLLQTPEYARRMFGMSHVPFSVDGLSSALAARIQRQLLLFEVDRGFEFLITEAALRWRPGPPSLMVAQLDRILSLSTLENVSIGIIPVGQEARTPMDHVFICYEQEEGDPGAFVEIEMVHDNVIIRDPNEVAHYRHRWSLLTQAAVFADDARQLLNSLLMEFRTRRD